METWRINKYGIQLGLLHIPIANLGERTFDTDGEHLVWLDRLLVKPWIAERFEEFVDLFGRACRDHWRRIRPPIPDRLLEDELQRALRLGAACRQMNVTRLAIHHMAIHRACSQEGLIRLPHCRRRD